METPQAVETDLTVQAFAQWLTELKGRSSRTLQEMLSEMSIIRDGITSNNMELTDFKRHSTGISQQMQSQLTDLREKLTKAFGEITALVKQKTQSDQELMQDINGLQDNLSCKTSELEALKRSYSQAHTQLQSSLIQIQNHLQVTNSEVQTARASCDRVQRDTSHRFAEIDVNLRGLEEDLSVGNAENRNQMLQLQEEIARIHESLTSLNAEFLEHKRATSSVHNKLQSQVWGLEEGRKRGETVSQGGPYQPEAFPPPPEPPASTPFGMARPLGLQAPGPATQASLQHAVAPKPQQLPSGSAAVPQPMALAHAIPSAAVITTTSPLPARGPVMVPATTALSPVAYRAM